MRFRNILSTDLDMLVDSLDSKIEYVRSEFGVELKSYGTILRIALNAIQKEIIENLIERILINSELETGLDNVGGYTVGYLKENDPKAELLKTLSYLKDYLPKQQMLIKFLNEVDHKLLAVFEDGDLEFVRRNIKNKKVELLSYSAFKKADIQNKALLFYSFNGKRDFDYLYHLDNQIVLVIYKQEKNLYYKYLDQRKKLIENEIKSSDRLSICGIQYNDTRDNVAKTGNTLNGITSRLDEMNSRTFEGYKSECDLLLSEVEEKLIYKISSDKGILYLESNDTLFANDGELIKCYKAKIGDNIRIYPKDKLAENLYQVAIETEPNIFGKVEEHSSYWKKIINELRLRFGEELLYKYLKERGLRILPATLATYGKSYRKFPMFNNDLRAIFKLYYEGRSDDELEADIRPILKSKAAYNSVMIVLGRGLKLELRLFLKNKKVGEILQKRSFNENTLQNFIDEFMPVHTITDKEIFKDKIETLEEATLQQIEL